MESTVLLKSKIVKSVDIYSDVWQSRILNGKKKNRSKALRTEHRHRLRAPP